MIGIVVPMMSEAKGFLSRLKKSEKHMWLGRPVITGSLGHVDCTVLITGCGKVLSASGTQLLLDRSEPDHVFHLGCAGALSKNLSIGDFVLGQEILEHDYYAKFGPTRSNPIAASSPALSEKLLSFAKVANVSLVPGRMLSGNEDIVESARRDELLKRHAGISVDWESFACAEVCSLAQLSVVVLRVIVDYAYENTQVEFAENLKEVCGRLGTFTADFLESSVV